MENSLVTPKWLNEKLADPNLIILDASEKTNVAGKKIKYEGVQIPGARFFDLENTFSDKSSHLPHTFPSSESFIEESRRLGINNNSILVVYDNIGVYTSPRVWWMYKIFGHKAVYVLDGGLNEWIENGYEIENTPSIREYKKGDFTGQLSESNIDTLEEIQSNLISKKKLLIDARARGRFNGTSPEPRDWVDNGHIPYSLNLPFDEVLNETKFKTKAELEAIFKSLNVGDRPLSFVCGSGLTSCILLLASELVQNNKTSVYDGSWTEWGSTKGLPIERG